jgi:hypothetical protein
MDTRAILRSQKALHQDVLKAAAAVEDAVDLDRRSSKSDRGAATATPALLATSGR